MSKTSHQSKNNTMIADSEDGDTDCQRQFKHAKPYQYRTFTKGAEYSWHISTPDGNLKKLSIDDWSASTSEISFCAWRPYKLTDECIDIWSPNLRRAICEACPGIYKSKVETCLSLQNILDNYDKLKIFLWEKEQNSSLKDQVLEELQLFVYVFLQRGDVAKILGVYGFEKLYKEGRLSKYHWEDIQQASFEKDLDNLDQAFLAATEVAELKEISRPPNRISESISDRCYWGFNALPCPYCCKYVIETMDDRISFRRMVPDEVKRYQHRLSIENANKILAAVSNGRDDVARILLEKNGYSGFAERSVELALRQEDFSSARLLMSTEFPMREAVISNDLRLVQLLISYEVDPNAGPCFIERPFPRAIINGNIDIARCLLKRCNIVDLGNLRSSLSVALDKGDLNEALSILHSPRTLTTQDIKESPKTMMQVLQQNLRSEHDSFMTASSSIEASAAFINLSYQLQDYRKLWKLGISAIRRLRKDRPPADFRQITSLLLVASAMRKTSFIEEFGDYDAFLHDLQRWKYLAVEESLRSLFDELVFCLWGQDMSNIPEDLGDFGNDINFLRSFAREFTEMSNMAMPADDPPICDNSVTEQKIIQPNSKGTDTNRLSEPPSLAPLKDPDIGCSAKTSIPPIAGRKSTQYTIAAYLRMGAIFAFFIACFLVIRGSIIQRLSDSNMQSPGSLSSLINTAYSAPDMLEAQSSNLLHHFVEDAKRDIHGGYILTIDQLDTYLYRKATSSQPLDQISDLSSVQKAIQIGSANLKNALKHWSLRKRFMNLSTYLSLLSEDIPAISCVNMHPASSFAADLENLSIALQKATPEVNELEIAISTVEIEGSTVSIASRSQSSPYEMDSLQRAELSTTVASSPGVTVLPPQSQTIIAKGAKRAAVLQHKKRTSGIHKKKQTEKANGETKTDTSEICILSSTRIAFPKKEVTAQVRRRSRGTLYISAD
ncbi:hypothetical protein B0O99DRAFT_677145 [Bisporella sp. PMI_857]|nr:hypothetical protein B0O99DRAFT_677145 [Bisporella sp. PMI_857]